MGIYTQNYSVMDNSILAGYKISYKLFFNLQYGCPYNA